MLRPYPGRNLPGTDTLNLLKLITRVSYFLSDDRSIFNYRLSRARRVIENSFGILAARWRLFRRPINALPERVRLYVQTAVALHNFLRTTESSVYCPPGFIDGEDGSGNPIDGGWRQDGETNSGMQSISQAGSNRCVVYCQCIQLLFPFLCRYSRTAAQIRDTYKDYFCSASGQVAWQYNHIHRTS